MCLLLRDWPIIEVVFVFIIAAMYLSAWRRATISVEDDREKRQLGATVVMSQLNTTVIAGTVALGLLGALAAVVVGRSSEALNAHVFYAALWALLSILLALWGLGVITSLVAQYDVSQHRSTALPAVLSLAFFAAAVGRLGLSLWTILYGTGEAVE